MPGMMDTVLNLGLNEQTLEGLIALTGNERFGWDAYRRFIQMFGRIVMDVNGSRFDEPLEKRKERHGHDAKDTDLTVDDLKALVEEFKGVVKADTGTRLPDRPLRAARPRDQGRVRVVVRQARQRLPQQPAHRPRPRHGRERRDDGVRQHGRRLRAPASRSPAIPTRASSVLYGEYLTNAQGEDVVAGIRTPAKISQLQDDMPEAYDEFVRIGQQLESHYRNVQDLEFTIERGRLYMLQTRDAKRTAAAAVKIAVDMVNEGTISKEEAVARIEPAQVDQLLRDTFDPAALKGAKKIVNGLNASPGAAVGRAVFDADTAVEWVERGEKVILVRIETSPDDFHGMAVSEGIITARGGATSHAAVVARQIGKPCVAGSADLIVDYAGKQAHCNITGTDFKEGDWVSLDGSTGALYLGAIPTVSARFEEQPELQQILGWADGIRRMGVWTNADKPEEAAQARSYGAQGIGLCRTEHMFREGDRLEIVRGAILVANVATRAKAKRAAGDKLTADEQEAVATFDAAMAKLEVLQQGDFEGIFKAMDGLPVVIRLIDPPLHEFLPNLEEQLVKVTRAEEHGGASEEDKQLLATIKSLHEQNPMLGLRGCRLGLMIPDFVKIQTRAILNAQIAVRKAGGNPIAKIMIPLVGHVNELSATRALLEAEAEAVRAAAGGIDVDYKFGTMIEVPRGALTADEIAVHADFFSFGTNDLTQMTFGYSRDDAEGGFLLKYVEDGILPVNPFQTLDDAVAGLMKVAADKGRATKPGLELGICGEHGGDPESIHKCERIGLDYVSCSPFRVPVARLAAAQAVLTNAAENDR